MSEQNYAIRFGLGAIKAVGFGMMEIAVNERKNAGKFKDVYDFVTRLDPKSINKKSIEALAKSGGFDDIANNRRQIFESFDVLSAYSHQTKDEASSSQMSMFGELLGGENLKPELKKVEDWSKVERLQKEFEAFGFFLNEHPLDDYVGELRKRGAVFCDKIERDEFEDNMLIKMAGVIAASKHRSGPRGRFAYLSISDPYGIFEAMIFDEALITKARDILVDGSSVVIECLVKKDEGGIRILVREVHKLDDFIKNTKPAAAAFEDIKKQPQRKFRRDGEGGGNGSGGGFGGSGGSGGAGGSGSSGGGFGGGAPKNGGNFFKKDNSAAQNEQALQQHQQRLANLEAKKIFSQIEILVKERDPIFNVKAALSRLIAPPAFARKTKVIFVVEMAGKKAVIELPEAYLLDENDVVRLRAIEKVIEVKAVE